MLWRRCRWLWRKGNRYTPRFLLYSERTKKDAIMSHVILTYQQLKEMISPVCEQFDVQELSLFGSYARGDAHEGSDYDFVVVFDHTKPGRRSDRFFGLLFFLEDNLSERIDLLELDAIRNPYLREAIERDKLLIYDARDQKAFI